MSIPTFTRLQMSPLIEMLYPAAIVTRSHCNFDYHLRVNIFTKNTSYHRVLFGYITLFMHLIKSYNLVASEHSSIYEVSNVLEECMPLNRGYINSLGM